jgi:hypothetical protein
MTNNTEQIDLANEIKTHLELLFKPGEVFEIRILNVPERVGSNFKATISGYFNNVEKAVEQIVKADASGLCPAIYCTLNPVKPSLLARAVNTMKRKPASTTADGDVARRSHILIDLDPNRPAGISASDNELQAAKERAEQVRDYLTKQGWASPTMGMSGNGVHLVYKTDLPADDGGMVQRLLESLSERFSDDKVSVDKSVFNPARITKIFGTMARKGDELIGVDGIEDRPHRRAELTTVGDGTPATLEQLEAVFKPVKVTVVRPIQQASTGQASGSYDTVESTPASVRKYLESHGVTVKSDKRNGRGYVLYLERCPVYADCESHGTDIAVLIGDDGVIAYKNQHDRGVGLTWSSVREALEPGYIDYRNKQQANFNARAVPATPVAPTQPVTPASTLPIVMLPGTGGQSISSAARELGRLMGDSEIWYNRGGRVVSLTKGDGDTDLPSFVLAKPEAMQSAFERFATLTKLSGGAKPRQVDAICNRATAASIIESSDFLDELPRIYVLSPCPLLVRDGDELKQVAGYDRDSGVFTSGRHVNDNMPIKEAAKLINSLLDDFQFASKSDRSRAMAAIITPALVLGGLLNGRAPIDLGEADDSQTGKGYRNQITSAIYRQNTRVITQKKGGVGSLEESFASVLIRGGSFVCIDNVRGSIDSPGIESFMTENSYLARAAYSGAVEIDPRRVVVMMTSNAADLTDDLANRVACVRLLKRGEGHTFTKFPEGDLFDHVVANQGLYLGAVFSIVRAWHMAGEQSNPVTGHDFRKWSQPLDWICQELLGAAPLLDGHKETQKRMTNAKLSWLRDVAIAVLANDSTDDKQWHAHELINLLDDEGMSVPGIKEGDDISEDFIFQKALRSIGRDLSRCFQSLGTGDVATVDGITIIRHEHLDDSFRTRKSYTFTRDDDEKSPF